MPPAELRWVPVGISHLFDVSQTADGECLPSVDVPRRVFVRLVNVARDAVAPVLMMSRRWVLGRWKTVDEFAVCIWKLNVFVDLIGNPFDPHLLESLLACRGEFLASLTQDPVAAFHRVHPDAVIVVPEREEVRSIGFKESHPGMEVLADAVCFLFLRRSSAEAGEVEHVAEADLVMRFPAIAEVEELLDRDRAAKLAMVVRPDDESLEAHGSEPSGDPPMAGLHPAALRESHDLVLELVDLRLLHREDLVLRLKPGSHELVEGRG